MIFLINSIIAIIILILSVKYFSCVSFYEKVLSFYLLFLCFLTLIINNSTLSFNIILDIILFLILFKFFVISLLIIYKK